jgi:hypothetical protein
MFFLDLHICKQQINAGVTFTYVSDEVTMKFPLHRAREFLA